jgi:hypothetical protein
MDPFWAEGDVSAVDQLNRLVARLRRALTSSAGATSARPAVISLTEPDHGAEPDGGEGLSPGARRLRTLG